MSDSTELDAGHAGGAPARTCPLPADRVRWWEDRKRHFPQPRALLLPLLHDVQDNIGCLTKEAMEWAADFVGITPVEVWGVASFYWMYDFEPRAKYRVSVCHNISCDLRGKDEVVAAIQQELGVERNGKPSADGMWSLRTVECMGACTTAPMMDVNGRYFEELTPEGTREILRRIRDGKEALPPNVAPLAKHPQVAHTYENDGKETTR